MTIVSEAEGDDWDNGTRSFLVLYTPTPAAAARFDAYRLRLEAAEGGGAQQAERSADAERRVRFSGLEAGRIYNVSMVTVSHGVASQEIARQARQSPRRVRELVAASVEARRVALRWDEPRSLFTDFEVSYLREPDRLRQVHTAELGVVIDDLRPYRNYTFTVEVRAGTPATLLARSPAVSLDVTTLQAPPGQFTV